VTADKVLPTSFVIKFIYFSFLHNAVAIVFLHKFVEHASSASLYVTFFVNLLRTSVQTKLGAEIRFNRKMIDL